MPNRTAPRWSTAVSMVRRSATWRTPSYSTVSPEIHRTPWGWPGQRSAKPMTSPVMGRLSGGPCRAGVAVTAMDERPRSPDPMVVVCQGVRPTALPPSRRAPAVVVRTMPADGSSARPASSRLSPWWSWVSRTASIGGRSAAATAGPVVLRDADPQPKVYLRPGASNVGSVSSRSPSTSIRVVGPPMWVIRTSGTGSPGVGHGPGEGVVGDLLPALLGGQQVGVAGVLLDLGHGVGLVVLGVGPLDAGRHEVVLAAGDE